MKQRDDRLRALLHVLASGLLLASCTSAVTGDVGQAAKADEDQRAGDGGSDADATGADGSSDDGPSCATCVPVGENIVGFAVRNNATAPSGFQYVELNQQFAHGAWPSGTYLAASQGDTPLPVQADITQRHDDGSVRGALITLAMPSIAAGETVHGTFRATSMAPSAALEPATIIAHGYDVSVHLAAEQWSGTKVIDVGAVLEDAIADGSAQVFKRGASTVQVRVSTHVIESLRLTFDISGYADGSSSTQVQFNNDIAMSANGGAVDFTAIEIRVDGASVFTHGALRQHQYQSWQQRVSSGASAARSLQVLHDIDYLQRIGAIQSFDLSRTDVVAELADVPGDWTNVLGVNGLTQYMPTTGGRADIGATTRVNALWLITQDPRAEAAARLQAYASGSVPWSFYDQEHGTYLSLEDYPALWIDGRAAVQPTQLPTDAGGWAPDTAHQPSLEYTAYILTGERYFLDRLNAHASWDIAVVWNEPRLDGVGLCITGAEQVRGQAWNMRELQNAAYANPDGTEEQAYFRKLVDNNYESFLSTLATRAAEDGELAGVIPGDYGNPGHFAPWQQDYFAMAVARGAAEGDANARRLLKWMAGFLSQRFLRDDMDPNYGYAYNLPRVSTWSAIQSAYGPYVPQPSGGDYAELALASNSVLISVFSGGDDASDHATAANAMRAYAWLLVDDDPFLRTDLQHQLVPRLRDGTQVGRDAHRLSSGDATYSDGGVFAVDVGPGGATLRGGERGSVLVDASADGGDTLVGGPSDDYLLGGKGTTTFEPGAGADYVAVGQGSARIIVEGEGTLEVAGFRVGEDKLVFTGDRAAAVASAAATADGVALSLGAKRRVELVGVTAGAVSMAIFAD